VVFDQVRIDPLLEFFLGALRHQFVANLVADLVERFFSGSLMLFNLDDVKAVLGLDYR